MFGAQKMQEENMKVSIEHEEKAVGWFGQSRLHGVKVDIQFSEKERSVIEQRGLRNDVVLERGFSAEISNSKAIATQNRGLLKTILIRIFQGADALTTNLTISKLMSGPDVFFLQTPLEAKAYEDELKSCLVGLKDYILGNEGIDETSSAFEL